MVVGALVRCVQVGDGVGGVAGVAVAIVGGDVSSRAGLRLGGGVGTSTDLGQKSRFGFISPTITDFGNARSAAGGGGTKSVIVVIPRG